MVDDILYEMFSTMFFYDRYEIPVPELIDELLVSNEQFNRGQILAVIDMIEAGKFEGFAVDTNYDEQKVVRLDSLIYVINNRVKDEIEDFLNGTTGNLLSVDEYRRNDIVDYIQLKIDNWADDERTNNMGVINLDGFEQ